MTTTSLKHCAYSLLFLLAPYALWAGTVDRIDFGDGRGVRIPKSEPAFWRSGPLSAKLKVDSVKRNYVTVRLSGSDVSHDHLLLLVDGRAMGNARSRLQTTKGVVSHSPETCRFMSRRSATRARIWNLRGTMRTYRILPVTQ